MKSILIIEDNPQLLESCSEILELSGYHVIQAKDGQEGVSIAIDSNPDLILCDIMMPHLDGYGVFSILTNNHKTAHIPFIFLSAKSDYLDMRKAMEMGADDYLTKPYNPDQLIKAIQTRINKATQQNAILPSIPQYENANLLRIGHGLEQLHQLVGRSKLRTIKKKQTLYYEGDYPQGLYLLTDGYIKTIKLTKDGRQLITGLYKPKDYIGLDALLLDTPFTESAEAIEDSRAYLLPKAMVVDILDKNPELCRHFIKVLSKNIHEKEEQLVELAYESVRKRLAQVLVRLSNHIQVKNISISREELAGLAGIATETVSRVLTDFKQEGLIEKTIGHIEVLDLDRLIKMKS
ncbi:response regulator [Pedobacter sp. Du54]|uniref:response regulator n=1 Tax=Pedobacter anseongensis TaxID=3133439 RepID=UPI0030AE49B3